MTDQLQYQGHWYAIQTGTFSVAGKTYDAVDVLLRPAEAAALAGVATHTLTRWNHEGRLTAMRTVGGHRRYRKAEVLRIMEGR